MTTHEIEQHEASLSPKGYAEVQEVYASEDCKEREIVTYYFRNKKHVGTKKQKEVLSQGVWFVIEKSTTGINLFGEDPN